MISAFRGEKGIIDMVKFGVKLPKNEHCKGPFLFLILILDDISNLCKNFGEIDMTFRWYQKTLKINSFLCFKILFQVLGVINRRSSDST